ncbi:MAG: NfeD family protein [Pleurocapsa sp.]
MNYLILIIAGISVAVGLFIGALIVWFIFFWRRRQVVDSLMRAEDVVGAYGRVEVPFDSESKGKIRVEIKGSMVDLLAVTEEAREFNLGDRVFVIQMKGNKVWVVGEDSVSQ